MFYDQFINLCNKRGLSPSAAAEAMGFQRSVVTRWSRGVRPHRATLLRVADYFGVAPEELSGAASPSAEAELAEYLELLRTRPECRLLLSTVKGASREEVGENGRFIEALRQARHD